MIQQLGLTLDIPESRKFDGKTFEPAKDAKRLGKQLQAVRDVLLRRSRWDAWTTLHGIQSDVWFMRGISASEASISARIRDLRKPKFGGYTVERRRISGGLYEYRIKL